MNPSRILFLLLAIAFLGLNLSVLITALLGKVALTFPLLGASFVVGVILYFLMRFHKKEKEYRQETNPNESSKKE